MVSESLSQLIYDTPHDTKSLQDQIIIKYYH